MTTYLLDANILIRLWREAPGVLDAIEVATNTDYRVTHDALLELVNGEVHQFFPRMSDKYQKLMKHLVSSPGSFPDKPYKENRFLKGDENRIEVVIGNKVSSTDHLQVLLCQNNQTYKLVTEDDRMQKSARLVLDHSRVLGYENFISELRASGIYEAQEA